MRPRTRDKAAAEASLPLIPVPDLTPVDDGQDAQAATTEVYWLPVGALSEQRAQAKAPAFATRQAWLTKQLALLESAGNKG